MCKIFRRSAIIIIFVTIFSSLLLPDEPAKNKIFIVYNNIPGDYSSEMETGSGFAVWIEFNNTKILFDVGGVLTTIGKNIQISNLDIVKVDGIIISHAHWDHVYGLPAITWMTRNSAVVYLPRDAKAGLKVQNPRTSFTEVAEPTELFPHIWTTGSMECEYLKTTFFEQSLILEQDNRIIIIAGCSHPGIIEIVKKAREVIPGKPIHLVAGGFHLRDHTDEQVKDISQKLKKLEVKNIAPSHCTGERAINIFKEEWKDYFIQLYLGDEYTF
jgi:7,8-dihydropterin-6-yl-methyl-4-(beta-D-ribofuranosyl)aminobenzene 5'-phosphate synthase